MSVLVGRYDAWLGEFFVRKGVSYDTTESPEVAGVFERFPDAFTELHERRGPGRPRKEDSGE